MVPAVHTPAVNTTSTDLRISPDSQPINDAAFCLWPHIRCLAGRCYRTEGLLAAVKTLMGASRMLAYRTQLEQLIALPGFASHMAADPQGDALFYISHRHFLSSGLSLAQRICCALNHFAYEGAHYHQAYHASVYGGKGLELWCSEISGVIYRLILRSTPEQRHEGPVSLVLLAGDRWLHELSFAWVDAALFKTSGHKGPVAFVTRNQSIRFDSPDLRAFRAAFPQNSPSYFCLAAMHGIVQLNGQARLAGIKHSCQIAFDERFAESFQNSYCKFWQSFGGVELAAHAYMMPVPPQIAPLSDIDTRHRARAYQRRLGWTHITEGTIGSLKPLYRTVSS